MSSSTIRVAWRNLGRNRRRTLLALAAIVLGQLTLVFVNCMMAGLYDDMFRTVTGPLVGHVQIHHGDWREERATDLYVDDLTKVTGEIRALPGVTSVSPRIYSAVLSVSGEKTDEPAMAEPAMIVGVDVSVEARKGGFLEDLGEEELPGGGGVVLGKVLANRLQLKPGQSIAVIGQDADGFPASDLFTVRAIVSGKVDVVKTMGVVMSVGDAGEFLAMPDQAHEIVVQGGDADEAEDLSERIAALPSLAGVEVLPWKEAAPLLAQMLGMKDVFDLIFIAIVFVAAAAGIANTATMSTFERTREFGMLLAVGARPGRIINMVLVESVALGLVGVAVGSVLGTAAVLITSHTGIDYAMLATNTVEDFSFKGLSFSYMIYPKFELRHVIFGIVAVTVTSVIASVWPAALAARLEPVEAMRS
ncbi:MAG: ABC transporter permease [Acidobacteriota bacterium]|nr:MAG: ABC transporter permease [Acidobacteriota bacterium]